jgi:hypothetical protein
MSKVMCSGGQNLIELQLRYASSLTTRNCDDLVFRQSDRAGAGSGPAFG